MRPPFLLRFQPLGAVLTAFAAVALCPGAEVPIQYERDIAPILRSHCAGCHNDRDREGKLSVETFAQLLRGGEDHAQPIRPGQPDESFLIASVEGRGKPKMPPKDEPPLPDAEKALLRQWVAAGAPGPADDRSILQTLTAPAWPGSTAPQAVTAVAISPDGNFVALGRSGSVELRRTADDQPVRRIEGFEGKVNALHFSADGAKIVVAAGIPGLHGTARLIESATGVMTRTFAGHADVLYDAELSPDGTQLATAGYDRTIRLWKVADGSLIRTIDIHKGAIFDLAWHPSGTVLASASADETVKLWRIADGIRLDTLNQPQGELAAVAFSADGQRILAAGRDRRVHQWRFEHRTAPGLNPEEISRFAHESPITAMALDRAGTLLLTAAEDRTVKLWKMPEVTLLGLGPTQPDLCAQIAAGTTPGDFFLTRLDGSVGRLSAGQFAQNAAAPAAQTSAASATPAIAGATAKLAETEPNNAPSTGTGVTAPAEITGAIASPDDVDCFRFHAAAGAGLAIEVEAARAGSKLDSRLQILTADGQPMEQVVLQATRDSWFTFRGKDSDTAEDFRLQNWPEMELDEFLYADGEVVKLWMYPRGPDSGFKVYPGSGKRWTYFGTTALAHPLNGPAYIVTPHPAGAQPAPNGLPVFRLNYENDDDPERRFGADSVVHFTAPTDADYVVRLTDVRGFGAPAGFAYKLRIRGRQPDFHVTLGGGSPKISPGSGRELTFSVDRRDGFDGPVRIDIAGLPAGFTATTPVEIEPGQTSALGAVYATEAAPPPDDAADKAVRIAATATIGGREVTHDIGTLGDLQIGPPAKIRLAIAPGADRSPVATPANGPMELTIRPGETVSAMVKVERRDFAARIDVGNETAGRNLPHGLYVDNIGLNGLLIVEGQSEREFFITASKIARPTARLFHLKTGEDGGQVSPPVLIRVVKEGLAGR